MSILEPRAPRVSNPEQDSLTYRVLEALEPLRRAGHPVEVSPRAEVQGALTVQVQSRQVVIVPVPTLLSGGTSLVDLVALAVRGQLALIALGPADERLKPLLARGLFDVLEPGTSSARLMLSVRNALEMLELRERSENRARWLRRFRIESQALIETARALAQQRDLGRLLSMILEKCREVVGADAGSIYVVEGTDPSPENRSLRFKLSQNESVFFPSSEFVISISNRSIAGSVVLSRKVSALEDVYHLPEGSPFAFDPSFDKKMGYRTRSVLTVPLINAEEEVIGVIQLINKKRDPRVRLKTPALCESEVVPFDEHSVELVTSLSAQAGIALENAMLYEEIRRIFDGFVRASVRAIEQRDPTTSGHSMRVSSLSCALAEAVNQTTTGPYGGTNFKPQDLRELEYASLLHDFGKIGVREEVLVKAKKLYDWQVKLIRARFDYLQKVAENDLLSRRAEMVARGAPAAELVALEAELARRNAQLESYWALLHLSNEPTVLPQDAPARLDELARLEYTDARGNKQPWLEPLELKSLKVARGSLTAEEFDEIRSHVRHTFEFLERIPWGRSFANVPMIAGCHHEKLNGRGYPRGLRGETIPVGSRIMAIADIFDALTASDRPYKRAMPVDKALNILDLEVRDGGLDGELVRIFVDAGVYRSIASETAG